MQEAVVKKIKSKILHSKFGEVFFVSSFPQYDVEYVTKLMAIFEKEGIISRISKGDITFRLFQAKLFYQVTNLTIVK